MLKTVINLFYKDTNRLINVSSNLLEMRTGMNPRNSLKYSNIVHFALEFLAIVYLNSQYLTLSHESEIIFLPKLYQTC